MKLLIVDDEELTRVGVISSINWQSIGIDANGSMIPQQFF